MPKVTPFLWFDTESEPAAELYTSVFPNSKILEVTRYGSAGPREEGLAMTVSFELDGQRVVALNGGSDFTLNEAFSFSIDCNDQDEVDYYWEKLTEGGGEEGQCGWLQDKYGLSWQVVPTEMEKLLTDADAARAERAMKAMLGMQKIDLAAIKAAADAA
jgi:predicted 3-demethylubiquinone-9 3-methyltransferase (glyoxalase superfamily)